MKYCKNCDKCYAGDAIRCEICGNSLEEKEPTAKKTNKKHIASKASRLFFCIAIVAITLILTSIITVVVFDGDRNPTIVLAIEVIILSKVCKKIMSDDKKEEIDNSADLDNTKEETAETSQLDSKYYYTKGTDIIGPFTAQQIESLKLDDDILIMNKDDEKWVRYGNVKGSINPNN